MVLLRIRTVFSPKR